MSLELVDSHCHVTNFEDPHSVIQEATSAGVKFIIGVGEDPDDNSLLLRIAERYSDVVKPCLGYHPWNAAEANDDMIRSFEKQVVEHVDVIYGIGEVGLDKRFVRGEDKFKRQLKAFEVALRLAKEYDLPLNIHTVKTERIVLELLVKEGIDKAVFHWYSGSYEVLEEIINLGYRVSVNLALGYSKRCRGVARRVPLALVLLESDSPYEFRGEQATPMSIIRVAEYLAKIRGVSTDLIARITSNNARILFGI
ncbi:MAG: TatD family hydrolase [Thermoprotei archaeon]|nr:TatD family hydrolase [Thermoprotei archaeon]